MSLQYQLVFALLVSEVVLFTILLLPLPLSWRRALLSWISTSPAIEQASKALRFILVLVLLLFVDSITRAYRLEHDHDDKTDVHSSNALHARLFHSQRNMYLCGFTLFLALVLNRFYAMIKDLVTNEQIVATLQKQSENNSKAYMTLLEEKKGTEELQKKIDEKDDEIKRLKKEVEKAKQDTENLVKQAEQQSKGYQTLMDEYASMEKKMRASNESKKDA